jgi:N-acetyltransferase 10
LPISRGKDIVPIANKGKTTGQERAELKVLKESLEDTKPVGELVKLAKTLDQVSSDSLSPILS